MNKIEFESQPIDDDRKKPSVSEQAFFDAIAEKEKTIALQRQKINALEHEVAALRANKNMPTKAAHTQKKDGHVVQENAAQRSKVSRKFAKLKKDPYRFFSESKQPALRSLKAFFRPRTGVSK